MEFLDDRLEVFATGSEFLLQVLDVAIGILENNGLFGGEQWLRCCALQRLFCRIRQIFKQNH